MSEDRTQAPSKLRLQQAREQGQVPHSPELTGAAVLLAGALMLSVSGEPLAQALIGLVRASWTAETVAASSPSEFVAGLRTTAWSVGLPLIGLLLVPALAAVFAHQAQTRGMFAPALIAPDFGRLMGGHAGDLGAKFGRGLWIVGKTVVIVIVAAWTIRSQAQTLAGLGGLDPAGLARAWAGALGRTASTLAIASLALGLVDFALQLRRFENLLKLTPAEAREDMKATEGDPALRSRRARIAKSWRGDSPELLVGVALAVVGRGGLIVLLSGGPPPKRVNVRSSAKGATGLSMRRSAEREKVEVVEDHSLARKLAMVRLPSLPPELAMEVKSIWPV